jgi:2-polyprenyl-6-methoxyphenol hydroxylase-like FAD-dependent oxidoreductase
MAGGASRIFAELGSAETPPGRDVFLGRAVVLGGSIAGLLAARVLSDHAEEVVILERDDAESSSRPGVPQGLQVHALLPGGRVQLDRWFPGFTAGAVSAGAVLSTGDAVRFYVGTTQKVTVPGEELLTCSRRFLEAQIRSRVLGLPGVRLIRAQAEGLIFDGGRVTGVALAESEEPADLVVDAMGRSSRFGEWLEAGGFPRPPMTRMAIALNYATARFRRGGRADLGAILAQRIDPRPGVAALNSIEDDAWMVMLAGFAEDKPGRDLAEFRERCRDGLPDVFAEVSSAEPIGDVVTYHQADSRRRDFHLVERLPAGFVAVGDAVASFNPVYGQGMSSATLHASCLSAYLRGYPDPHEPARGFFALERVAVDAAWSLSTSADLALPHVAGPYPRGYRAASWYTGRVIRASVTDVEVNRRFNRIGHMLDHPGALLKPGMLWRALKNGGGRL